MSLISCVINLDTRPERENQEQMFNGVVDREFLIEGLINKKRLFGEFEMELIVFIDEHQLIEESTMNMLRFLADTLIVRKHNKKFENQKEFSAFNDLNYLTALFSARGKYIFHFDGDIAAFAFSQEAIQEQIGLLEKYDYISYPSHWSPNPVDDSSFGNKYWVSTRYFCCKRETLNFSEILKCQLDYDYWKETYPVPRLCHWTEHIASSISHHKGKGVYYPPIDYNKFILFCWDNYQKGLLEKLNTSSFEQVKEFVLSKGGIFYPNNLRV